ncbi:MULTISPECIES: AMIN domain-containing protein [Anaeromyxobacter]|uniref:AMIN domain-containing protein n=2 Tax=Anaeromyxobacteraceae TaxID=1524215 RepID=UPI001F55F908|nr:MULTISPECIES: AMIN domain-containing protein [unclassified Anaeromyxobacter]
MRPRHLVALVLAFAGSSARAAGALNVVTAVEVKDEGAAVVLQVKGSKPPNFTTFSMADPPRFVIDLSEARLQGVPEDLVVRNGVVNLVKNLSYGSEATAIARIMVAFQVEVDPPEVLAEGNTLVVRVAKPAGASPAVAADDGARAREAEEAKARAAAEKKAQEEAAARAAAEAQARAEAEKAEAAAAAEKARVAEVAAAEEKARAAEVAAAEEKARAAEADRAKAGVEADAQPASAAAEEQSRAEAEAKGAAEARAAYEKERQEEVARSEAEAQARSRAEGEAREAEASARAEADRRAEEEAGARAAAEARAASERELAAANGKAAALDEAPAPERSRGAAAESHPEPAAAVAETAAEASAGRLDVGAPRAQLREVGFKQMSGVSRVFVRTSVTPRFSVQDVGENVIRVELENTRATRRNDLRHLDTSFFSSAVAVVTPARRGSSYVLDIKLRERVPYQQRIEGDMLAIDFERPAAPASLPVAGPAGAAPGGGAAADPVPAALEGEAPATTPAAN